MKNQRKREARTWDVFISHASEDKEKFVEPLANTLVQLGVTVWYDKFSLTIGDSLSRSIDIGLSRSRFGLVVVSRSFVSKPWPEYELRGLTAKELATGKVIIPIWHGVSFEEILAFSPPLADKLAIKTDGLSPLQVAVKVVEVIRPDLLSAIMRRVAFYRRVKSSRAQWVDPAIIKSGPIRHNDLSSELVGRIRLIRASLLGIHTHSMSAWLDGFKRDADPSREVAVWER
ncbi:MAG TPA: toll/interleukin-1 receptor domain-containing protein [Terracidiphilus sp.]|nr:toll/interleukin-1 receptor domain-containing protein [Terracidiphilus sp.]